jgi:putative CocE/NonD family hydrolase
VEESYGFNELKVQFDVPFTLSDGTVLRSNIYSPVTDLELPVLLLRLPYDKNIIFSAGGVKPADFARRGFIVVVQDVRGRFASDGEFEPSINEHRDGYESVQWASKLPGSNGNVGTYGDSYLAEVQWSAALMDPPALKAIAPGVSPSWSNHDGFMLRGGVHEIGSRLMWVFGAISPDYTFRHSGKHDLATTLEILDSEGKQFEDLSGFGTRTVDRFNGSQTFLEKGTELFTWSLDDERHAINRTRGRHHEIDIPVFMYGGWYDVFLGSTLLQYRAVLDQCKKLGRSLPKLVIGPWTHMEFGNRLGAESFGAFGSTLAISGGKSLFDRMVEWLKSNLQNEPAKDVGEKPVHLFITGSNDWLQFDEFPFGFESHSVWYLNSGGRLSLEKAEGGGSSEFDFDPRNPAPTIGGPTLIFPGTAGPFPQNSLYDRNDIVRFVSEPLDSDQLILGQVGATIYVSSSAKDTDFVVRLCDQDELGVSRILADGIIRCRYRNDFDLDGWKGTISPADDMNGEVVELNISMWAVGHTVKAGHRLGIDVTSSSFPRWQVNSNTGKAAFVDEEMNSARQKVHFDGEYLSRVFIPMRDRSSVTI